jgi:hypothetical protein
MSDTTSDTNISIGRLILVPSLITLAITLLRVVGELQHWSKCLFNATILWSWARSWEESSRRLPAVVR